MTLWHRAPREVYRVYGEDEYLAEGETHAEDYAHAEREVHAYDAEHAEEETRRSPIGGKAQRSRSGRLVGLGLLAGVMVGALVLVVLNASHRSSAAPQRGVAQSTETPTARRPSAGALADPNPAVRVSTGTVSNRRESALPRMRASVRQPFRLRLRAGSPIDHAPRAASAETGQLWPSASGLSESDTAAPAADEEFDFER